MDDEGLFIAVGPCYVCTRHFNFNPATVPSYDPSKDDPTQAPGARPICASCVAIINRKRAEAGLRIYEVYPDSYGAATHAQMAD